MIDREQRQRVICETNRSFAVEASAGTGKTTTLVNRILHLVLEKGPSGPPIRLSEICAITFTEKAAGEMKIRLRQEFERAALQPLTADLARRALRELEGASVSTFHAFAVSLLKERPVEAELDPRFTALDDVQGNLFFAEVWEEWLRQVLMERRYPIEAALRGGFDLQTLRSIARNLASHSSLISRVGLKQPLSDAEIHERKLALLEKARAFRLLARPIDDKLLRCLDTDIAWLGDPSRVDCPARPGSAGRPVNWDGATETVEAVRKFLREVSDFAEPLAQLHDQRFVCQIVSWLRDDFLATWRDRKRAAGVLDFDDQLVCCRDLLLKSRSARREFQQRYKALLVDEFQDTDSVQLDIVLLLSATDPNETDTHRLKPGPGRLFLVGDPKQSIYRFRGADIETYLETVEEERLESLGMESVPITTNFRSVPSILRFVDAAFGRVMKTQEDGAYQPAYAPFGEAGARVMEDDPPSVFLFGDRDASGALSGSGPEYVRIESARLAKLILKVHGSDQWGVQEPAGSGTRSRAPRFGDMAVLLPALTHVDLLEEALRDAGIPYVLEGGKFYYARSEVSSAMTVLRVVANPNDTVALYGSLRSIFFGVSDEDLLREHAAGQRLDYRAAADVNSPLSRPFAILRDLHEHRFQRTPSETFETLLNRTRAREVLAVRGFQSIANLNKLARTLRLLQPGRTFSEVVECLFAIDEEGAAEAESRVMEERSDAVRLLSIHKSKGLDFPIVFLAGLGIPRRPSSGNFLADTHKRMYFAVGFNSGDKRIATPGWKELRENDSRREYQELIRLLYVAMTRARDHLLVSTHHGGKVSADDGSLKASFDKTRLQPLADFLAEVCKTPSLARFVDGTVVDELRGTNIVQRPAADRDWVSIVRRESAEIERLIKGTPESKFLFAAGDAKGEERVAAYIPESVRERAVRLGLAFHEAMEIAQFERPQDAGVWVRGAGAAQQIDTAGIAVLETLVRITLESPLIARARAAARAGRAVLRELPFVRPIGTVQATGMEEGKIDLLFEESEGWVLVDYKTDQLPAAKEDAPAVFTERYAGQIGEYVAALRQLGLNLKAAYLLLARSGESIEMPLSTDLIASEGA